MGVLATTSFVFFLDVRFLCFEEWADANKLCSVDVRRPEPIMGSQCCQYEVEALLCVGAYLPEQDGLAQSQVQAEP